jgi:NarL family two-component system response regulator LiaR
MHRQSGDSRGDGMERIRVLLADNHAMFREGLRAILDKQDDMTVVGEAEDGVRAAKKASELAPDIILMDVEMPVRDGVEASRLIAAQNPQVGIIILTVHNENNHVLEAIKAGARGYILKSARAEELIETIRAVHRGGAVLAPAVMSTLLDTLRHLADDSQGAKPVDLTEREAEILCLVARGKSNREIADLLSLSEQTIKNRLSAIYPKLKVANRAEAVACAIRQGLIALE